MIISKNFNAKKQLLFKERKDLRFHLFTCFESKFRTPFTYLLAILHVDGVYIYIILFLYVGIITLYKHTFFSCNY